MKRFAFFVILLTITASWTIAFAGGASNKSNLSTRFMSTPSNARTDSADIAAYNPAGTVLLPKGLSLDFSTQLLFEKRYNIKFDDRSQSSKDHETTKGSVIPALYGAYNFGSWSLFGGVNVPVGGGKIDYENGNLTTYQLGQTIAARTSGALPGSFYALDSHSVEANHFGMNFFAGTAFRPWKWASFSGAIRYIDADLELDGKITTRDAFGRFPSFDHQVKFDGKASGVGGVFGLDLFPTEGLTLGLRYETPVRLDYEFDVEKDTPGILPALGVIDGGKKRDDLPATLAFGAEYVISDHWTIRSDVSWYMNTKSKLGGTSLRDNINGQSLDELINDSYEIGIGAQYTYATWRFNLGYLYSNMGVPTQYSSNFLPDLDAHTLGFSTGWNPWKTLHLSMGIGNVFYVSDSYTNNTLSDPRLGPYAQPDLEVKLDKNVFFGEIGLKYYF